MPDPSDDSAPPAGFARGLSPGLRRILAPNPSAMTFWGTNTYLLGDRDIAVIDPGPDDPGHLRAILDTVPPGARVSHILVTHAHRDHSPLARPLAAATGAPVMAFGGATAGRSAAMEELAAAGLAGGGEGVDHDFEPDVRLADGTEIEGVGWRLTALHTPGHMGNHVSLAWGETLFTGDHVMGWASSLVSPPDGDVSDFMASCARLRRRGWRVFHPGHGGPVAEPRARLDWLIGHRHAREAQIRAALAAAPGTAAEIARRIYTDTPEALLPAATRNVLAHLLDLRDRGLAQPEGALREHAVFAATVR